MDRSQLLALFFQPVDLHDKLPHLALQAGFFLLLFLCLGRTIPAPLEHSGRRFQNLPLPLRHLHRVQVVFRRDLLHGFHSLERLKRDPRFELRAVVSSLLLHVSVGFGYTPETLRNLTISLAPFQRATSTFSPLTWLKLSPSW